MIFSASVFVTFYAFSSAFAALHVAAVRKRLARSPDNVVTIQIVLNDSDTTAWEWSPTDDGSRIVNGTSVTPGEFPFLVAILDITNPSEWYPRLVFPWERITVIARPYCSGTLVTLQYVLTACHCVLDLTFGGRASGTLRLRTPRTIMTIAGRENIDPFDHLRTPSLVYNNPSALYHHPDCRVAFSETIWDVGIMELETAYTEVRRSIEALPLYDFHRIYTPSADLHRTSREWFEGLGQIQDPCVTTGHGLKWVNDKYNAYKATVLLQSSQNCSEKLRLATQHLIDGAVEFHNQSQICTVSNSTPCDGDSGGPLFCNVPDIEFRPRYKKVQVGVVSHSRVCGNESVPVIYARIDEITNWIYTIVPTIIPGLPGPVATSDTAILDSYHVFIFICLLTKSIIKYML